VRVVFVTMLSLFLVVDAVADAYPGATAQRIAAMEAAIARSQAEIAQLLAEEQQTIEDFEQTKKLLLKTKPCRFCLIRKPMRPSLTQLDFTRYPPSPFPNYFKYRSMDGLNEIEFHSWLQVDQDIFMNAQGLTINNGISSTPIYQKNTVDRIWLRRLRPSIEGFLHRYLNYFINLDFGQGQIRLYDAFIDINYFRLLGLQSGLQMSLLSGIENYFENFNYLARSFTMEMSNTAMLAPDREFGFVFHGSLGPSGPEPYFRGLSYLGFDDFFSYQIGIMSGTADNSNPGVNPTQILKTTTEESTVANKALEGRVFWNPFIAQPQSFFHHLGLGFAASTERAHLQSALPNLDSLGQNQIFYYTPSLIDPEKFNFFTLVANGLRTRVHPQAVFGRGPLGILADWGQTLQTLAAYRETVDEVSSLSVIQKNHANQIQVIYNLTQEPFNLFHLMPNRPFHFFEKGAIGAWQLVFRYTGLSLDPSVFSKYSDVVIDGQSLRFYPFADPRVSVQSSSSFSIGLNWFWNPNLRFTLEYDHSSFKGGCSTGALNAPINPGCLTAGSYAYTTDSQVLNRPDEQMIMQRFQLTF